MAMIDSGSSPPDVVYDRSIAASTERIWENVLDWEHLPHLHAQAFAGIRVLDSNEEGWRAFVQLAGEKERGSEIEVVLDRPGLRYTTRTLSGAGEGSEIVTGLFPRTEHETEIRVEFFLPWLQPEWATGAAEAYRALYRTLWDQDEEMMLRRRRVLERDSPAPSAEPNAQRVCLGSRDDLDARLPVDVEVGGRAVRVVSIDGDLLAFDASCPHLGGPLAQGGLSGHEVRCPWHGYRFDLRTGRSCDGRGYRLAPAPRIDVEEDGGLVFVSPSCSPARASSSGRG